MLYVAVLGDCTEVEECMLMCCVFGCGSGRNLKATAFSLVCVQSGVPALSRPMYFNARENNLVIGHLKHRPT